MMSEIVTEQEYLQAIEVVYRYHRQVECVINKINSVTKVTLRDFLDKARISTRLYRIIVNSFNLDWSIEKIDRDMIMRQRGGGRKTWEEFVAARAPFISELQKTLALIES